FLNAVDASFSTKGRTETGFSWRRARRNCGARGTGGVCGLAVFFFDVDAEEALELLFTLFDLVVVLVTRALLGLLSGLVETFVGDVGVLAGELLGFVEKVRHSGVSPLMSDYVDHNPVTTAQRRRKYPRVNLAQKEDARGAGGLQAVVGVAVHLLVLVPQP